MYTENPKEASLALKNVFGIKSLSPAIRIEADFELIKEKSLGLAKNKGKKKTNVMLFSILWAVVTAMLFSCLIISLELKK